MKGPARSSTRSAAKAKSAEKAARRSAGTAPSAQGFDAEVAKLATLAGVAQGYSDAYGAPVETPLETRRALLEALGLPVGSPSQVRESARRVRELRAGPVPALVVAPMDRAWTLTLRTPLPGATWTLLLEAGGAQEGRMDPEAGGALALPPLPMGYHRLEIAAGGERHVATLIAAPESCWRPDALEKGERWWGLTAQLYGLRTERDGGVGDYTAVAELAAGAGRHGASFLGLSPVHALFPSDRTKFSPYSPSSRLFLETLYIDPQAVQAPGRRGRPAPDPSLERLRSASLVDYEQVWAPRRAALEALWGDGSGWLRDADFQRFREQGGEPLALHAAFEALSEQQRSQGAAWPGAWPDDLRDVRSAAVEAFRRENQDRIAHHQWLQWLADRQLGAAAEAARASGMGLGLYRDLAVGPDRGGSELWSAPDRFVPDFAVGAPPDLLGPQGQNWGLPAFNPITLAEQGLAGFRALVAANARHAGAVRIDHAFQLARLFLIPPGAGAADGAYLDYPFEALLASLRIESHRAQCLVIAEDLGTAPEGFSDAIMASGVLSYRIFFFEQDEAGFKPPAAYPRAAMAALSTHDLPTFAGWWRGLDVDLREAFGIYDADRAAKDRDLRVTERERFLASLAAEGLARTEAPPAAPPVAAASRFLARTPSSLLALQVEDVAGDVNQANMPGLVGGYPNWRRRTSKTIAEIVAPDGPLARLAQELKQEGRGEGLAASATASATPRATYRFQFHAGFTFDDAVKVAPDLIRLGISHAYASPIQKARPGSTHGYDIVDHGLINPELGGEEGFRRFSDALRANGLGLVVDIVPNHMGVGKDNPLWRSMLAWGPISPDSQAFDVDWDRPGLDGKILLPVLGRPYGESLEAGELRLVFEPAMGGFCVAFHDERIPVGPLTWPVILDQAAAGMRPGSADRAALLGVADGLRSLARDAAQGEAVYERAALLAGGLVEQIGRSRGLRKAVDAAMEAFSGSPGDSGGFEALHRLLEAQAWRLAEWRLASSDLNYRRFFDVNTLAGLRVEIPAVFDRAHALIVRLVREGRIQGLRIDHIDGLADPEAYLRDLRRAVGDRVFIVAEKILEPGERLRPWPLAGTTGYDVMGPLDGVFVDPAAEAALDALYDDVRADPRPPGEQLNAAKTELLETSFASEREAIVLDLAALAAADRNTRDLVAARLRRAVVAMVAAFPVYRTYLGEGDPAAEDVALLDRVVEEAKSRLGPAGEAACAFVRSVLLDDGRTPRRNPAVAARIRRRFQQLTGPVMAKGLEDTLFYRHVRLLALNEVGGDPSHFGLSVDAFHEAMQERARDWPNAMTATATHDTKRGEDARARLIALAEEPQAWAEALAETERLTASAVTSGPKGQTPDANDRWMILQTILGAWPVELLDGDDRKALASFRERLHGYVEKALRESKRRSSWLEPDAAYEAAAREWISAILSPKGQALAALRPLARRLAQRGALTSLARTALKCAMPGVPDFYQGTEFWDLSLVDPDNRRPVDYRARSKALGGAAKPQELLASWPDGRVKQALTRALLADRAASPELYGSGDYRPLRAEGARAAHVLAFARSAGSEAVVVVLPRLAAKLLDGEGLLPRRAAWAGTTITLPEGTWRDVVTGERLRASGEPAPMAELFSRFPIAVLRASHEPTS